MTETTKRWIIALGYVILIYATLEVVRIPIGFLRSHGMLRISLFILYTLCLVGVIDFLRRHRPNALWRYSSFCALVAIYTFAVRRVKIPEEQIHFFQYGLVGIFFFRALESQFTASWKTFFAALVLATMAGWLDETIQGFLPSRHYDVRDILLNFVSAFLGLFVYTLLPSKHGTNPYRS